MSVSVLWKTISLIPRLGLHLVSFPDHLKKWKEGLHGVLSDTHVPWGNYCKNNVVIFLHSTSGTWVFWQLRLLQGVGHESLREGCEVSRDSWEQAARQVFFFSISNLAQTMIAYVMYSIVTHSTNWRVTLHRPRPVCKKVCSEHQTHFLAFISVCTINKNKMEASEQDSMITSQMHNIGEVTVLGSPCKNARWTWEWGMNTPTVDCTRHTENLQTVELWLSQCSGSPDSMGTQTRSCSPQSQWCWASSCGKSWSPCKWLP